MSCLNGEWITRLWFCSSKEQRCQQRYVSMWSTKILLWTTNALRSGINLRFFEIEQFANEIFWWERRLVVCVVSDVSSRENSFFKSLQILRRIFPDVNKSKAYKLVFYEFPLWFALRTSRSSWPACVLHSTSNNSYTIVLVLGICHRM
jgi:hypothetical protein